MGSIGVSRPLWRPALGPRLRVEAEPATAAALQPAGRAGAPTMGTPAVWSQPQALILLVEDGRALREEMAYTLRCHGFKVHTAENADATLVAARSLAPDLILLDVLLPGSMDGLEVCRRLCDEVRAPIILLSARAQVLDRVAGLEVGADDYVAKPFSMVELLARIKAHLRRASMDAERAQHRRARVGVVTGARRTGLDDGASPAPLVVGDLVVDPRTREVRLAGRKLLHLKRRPFDLLRYLAQHPGQIMSRSHLLHVIWPHFSLVEQDTRTVDVTVHRVRTHIEADPEHPRRLLTVRGVGYVLQANNPEAIKRGK
jgi:DNA-binding response OmpR family regulator